MTTLYLNIHAIRPLGPNSANRGGSGEVKTLTYNGTTRQYLSSQSHKASMRRDMLQYDSDCAIRTKRLKDILLEDIEEDDKDKMLFRVSLLLTQIKKYSDDVVLSLNKKEIENWKHLIKDDKLLDWDSFRPLFKFDTKKGIYVKGEDKNKNKNKTKETKETKGPKLDDIDKNIIKSINKKFPSNWDQMFFGTMYANDAGSNVEAQVQVAPAISINGIESTYDYFTAMDDYTNMRKETGAAMISESEFVVSTVYEYESINIHGLLNAYMQNISLNNPDMSKDEVKEQAIDLVVNLVMHFVKVCFKSVPTGKQNSFANVSKPATFIMELSESNGNYADAFAEPTKGYETYAKQGTEKLLRYRTKVKEFMTLDDESLDIVYKTGIYFDEDPDAKPIKENLELLKKDLYKLLGEI